MREPEPEPEQAGHVWPLIAAHVIRATDQGLSERSIARLAGVAPPVLWRYLHTNRMPPVHVAERVAKAIGLRLVLVPEAWDVAAIATPSRTRSRNGPRSSA